MIVVLQFGLQPPPLGPRQWSLVFISQIALLAIRAPTSKGCPLFVTLQNPERKRYCPTKRAEVESFGASGLNYHPTSKWPTRKWPEELFVAFQWAAKKQVAEGLGKGMEVPPVHLTLDFIWPISLRPQSMRGLGTVRSMAEALSRKTLQQKLTS